MKLSKRLLLSNIVITLLSMFLLSIILSNFVTQFIMDDAEDDLWSETKIYMSFIEYRDVAHYIDGQVYLNPVLERKKAIKETYNLLVIEDGEDYEYASIPTTFSDNISKENLETLIEGEMKQVTSIKIDGTNYFALTIESNDLFQGEYRYYFVSLIPADNVSDSIKSMRLILLAVGLLISLLTFIITTYYDKQLTRPIQKLVSATERIAEKDFNDHVSLKTGDEFETLATAINQMSDRLNELDIEQKQFYENISHDIKTPLAVISGYAQNIQSGVVENQSQVLETIVTECDRLKTTLENVIFLSKLDSVEEFFEFKTIDIHHLIGRSLDSLQSLFVLNGVDVYFEPEAPMVIEADEKKMEKALVNIFMNCIKYTESALYIQVTQASDSCEIVIEDNGNGFMQSILENPISRRIISEKGGNGIGLSIIEKVITAHHGQLKLQNTDRGAMYIITLPI